MRRMIAICLLLLMLVGLVGCTEKQVAEVTTAETTEEITQPGPVTLTVGIRKSHLVTDYEANYYTQWLEEQTGYRLEFQYFSTSAGTEDLMVETMADRDLELPDLILDIELSKQTIDRYGAEGKLVNLAPYFEDKESVWWQRYEQLNEETQKLVWAAMESDDGGIYGFPAVQESVIGSMDYQVWINREWLETLSLEMPKDPESLYAVLKAFKENDPNGNGEADEIPLLGTQSSPGGDVLGWLVNMFLYYDDNVVYQLDENGRIYVPALTDRYRQALQYIRRLYEEELLNPMSFSAQATDVPVFMEKHHVGILCADVLAAFSGDQAIYKYDALPLWGTGVINPAQVSISGFVTKDCENVDAAWNLLMVMSSEESSLIQRYGEKDIDWMWASEGSRGVMEDVEPQLRLFVDTRTVTGNNNWRAIVATILTNTNLEGLEVVPGDDLLYQPYRMAQQMWNSYQTGDRTPERIFPAYGSSTENQEKLRNYSLNFIVGRVDINDDAAWQLFQDKFAYLNDEAQFVKADFDLSAVLDS